MNNTYNLYRIGIYGVFTALLALPIILILMERSHFLHDAEYHWPMTKVTIVENLSNQKLTELRAECDEPIWVVKTGSEMRARCGTFWPKTKIFVVRHLNGAKSSANNVDS